MRIKYPVITLILFLAGCALPYDTSNQQNFVPEKELSSISYAREGLFYLKKSRFVDAEFMFRRALIIEPEAVNLQGYLAVALEKQGQYEEALRIYSKLLTLFPDSLFFRKGYAHTLYSAAQYDEAALAYQDVYLLAAEKFSKAMLDEEQEEVAKLLRELSTIARSLAVLNFQVGNEELAKCFSDEALSYSATPEEKIRHTRLLIALSLYDNAAALVQGGAELPEADAADPRFLRLMALISSGQGKFEDSLKYTRKAKESVSQAVSEDEFEIRLLEQVAMLKTGAQPEKEIDKEEDQEDEDQEADPLSQINPLETALSLYLPLSVLEVIEEQLQQQELEGLSS